MRRGEGREKWQSKAENQSEKLSLLESRDALLDAAERVLLHALPQVLVVPLNVGLSC